MRLRVSTIAFAALAGIVLQAGAAQAAITFTNGSFEAGLAGWTTNSEFIVTPSAYLHDDHAGTLSPYDPVDGASFASLLADGPVEAVTLRQTFVTSGGLFSGWAAFSASDAMPYNDSAYVKVFNDSSTYVLFAKDVNLVGAYGQTGWTAFSTALAAGTWTVEAGVVNAADNFNPSHLLLDDFAMAEAPEPATWALMLLGFGALGATLRQRRARSA